ncbi:PREDICTED: uncharacterized protein LOC106805022 [Priapulus caudatus]|uniref:Uncharacterized protein LOC106805022 n=1 Tax=Priapulus caudatus TaxID=37621 RepID=A0ABM1DPV6_PRICU|nr:PREDICTED: uncharacterized protein LOC106805022 [Priapulus caudatus]
MADGYLTMRMNVALGVMVVVAVAGLAHGDGYVTQAPSYFTTQVYGPVSSGALRGSGNRAASLSFNRAGTASGTAYSQDQATADQTAAKNRAYEYNYKLGGYGSLGGYGNTGGSSRLGGYGNTGGSSRLGGYGKQLWIAAGLENTAG